MENWQAAELLPKINVQSDVFYDIKTYTAEELFENLRLYYGDDPNRYNISFEALMGIYCNKIEWVNFFHTAIAVAANVIQFDDLNKMSLGKVLFHIQIPRVATGNDVTAPKQTTIIVTKYTEKHPINISFELSSACLQHLENTFKKTILDQIMNINAINTMLRSLKNSVNALNRGLIHAFVQSLLKKAPPHFIVKTMMEVKVNNRQSLSRVQRSNLFQSFKTKFISSLFFLNRINNVSYIYRLLCEMIDTTTESILNNTNTYIAENGTNVNGVLIGTPAAIQTLLSLLTKFITKTTVTVPTSYGKFVMGKENAVNAIAYQAIMGDFESYSQQVGTEKQDILNKSNMLDKQQDVAKIKMNLLQAGDKSVAIDHLGKIYKNTETKDPLEREIEISFFFPLGLYIPYETGFSTMENKLKLNDTAENNLPTTVFFHNKDKILQKIDYCDLLKTLCHPAVNDATIEKRIFEAEPRPTGHLFEKLCIVEFVKESPRNILAHLFDTYELQEEIPKTVNMIKNEFNTVDFYKPDNITLYTELHPFFDITHYQNERRTDVLCTPRIMVGNMPLPLTPGSFHEMRAKKFAELGKTNIYSYDLTIQLVTESLNSSSYPELAYFIEILVHGNRMAFQTLKEVISQAITHWFNSRHILLFCNNFEMIMLIASCLCDENIPSVAYNHYRNIVSILRLIKRTISVSNINGNLCGEPLCNYVNALFDPRLFSPFLHTMPRNEANALIFADEDPLTNNTVRMRNYELSDVPRMDNIDTIEVFTDLDRPSLEVTILSKIYYFCFLPALTNNKMCGAGVDLKNLILDFFYDEPFISNEDIFYEQNVKNEILLEIIKDGIGPLIDSSNIAKDLFKSVCFINENTKLFQIESPLDAAQRHGNAENFQSIQHVLYNGLCLITPINQLRTYVYPIPFHRFFSDPNICGIMNADIQTFLNTFPYYQKNDGSFPLPKQMAHEYHNWHRTPFFIYSATCSNTLLSILTLASMHSKLSPISTAVQSKNKCHPGFAVTLVRTDVFEVDYLLYSSKASTSVILDEPTVIKEEKDIATNYNFTQHIGFIDMGLGYSSTTSHAFLKRVKTDMGSKTQDLFCAFPMHAFTNTEINTWLRQYVGIEQTPDSDMLNILTFGSINKNTIPILLHGQQAICEAIITPVTADINFFKTPQNPRGRASCMMGVDPHNEPEALKALYDHKYTDSQTFASTVNPWSSQKGSLGDILYNMSHRDQLGYNPKTFSPCSQFFTSNEIIKNNKLMYKIINEYSIRSKTCIDGDVETQYSCIDGTNNIVHKPCQFLQEAFPIHSSSSQALLESRIKSGTIETCETHYNNFAIGETIPLQTIIAKATA